MSIIELVYPNGERYPALQVGNYAVSGCCGTGENARYAVFHKNTLACAVCGLTRHSAVLLADTLSTYGEDFPRPDWFDRGPCIKRIIEWARECLYAEGEPEYYVAYHERVYGNRPKAQCVPMEQLRDVRHLN